MDVRAGTSRRVRDASVVLRDVMTHSRRFTKAVRRRVLPLPTALLQGYSPPRDGKALFQNSGMIAMRARGLAGLFFISGISALIYELVWQRLLNLVFGNSTLAVSAVLAA